MCYDNLVLKSLKYYYYIFSRLMIRGIVIGSETIFEINNKLFRNINAVTIGDSITVFISFEKAFNEVQ